MKCFTFIALLAFVATASAYHDLLQGYHDPEESLLFQKKIDVDNETSKVVEHEEVISGDGNLKISRIEAVDYKREEISATPHIISGGIGQSHIRIKFISERGRGIHFTLKVYGK